MTDELTPKIRARAKSWATAITKAAHRNLGNKRRLINVKSTVTEQKGMIGVTSVATPALPIKPVARAYEYGSGIHSRLSKKSPKQLSAKGKILIRHRLKKVLAFHWEVADANPADFIFGKDGKVLLPSVKHPGVKAVNNEKGYLGPAVREVRKSIRKELSKDTRDAVLGTFRRTFKRR